MVSTDEIEKIANELLEKTRAGQVNWRIAGSSKTPRRFGVTLPQSRIFIEYQSPHTDADFIALSISRPDNVTVGSLEAAEGTPNWKLLRVLYQEASRVALGWDKVLEDVTEALKTESVGTDAAIPPEDCATAFLEWAAGEWVLKYTPKGEGTKSERITIHPDGVYDVPGKPQLKITAVEYDPVAGTVSFNKTRLADDKRPIHHREVLTIASEDAMIGNREGDPEHILDYTRVKGTKPALMSMFVSGRND
jgi:hypothetical protein